MSAAVIGRNLHGQRQGHDWRCSCPLGCGYALSLSDGEDGRLLAFCYGGCEFDEIAAALVEHGLFDDEPVDFNSPPVVDRVETDPRRIEFARRLYAEATHDERIGLYLASRSITISSPVLRFLEQAPHRLGARLPAMLAPIVDVNGEQIGTHSTFLRSDGAGKADLGKEFQRETRGRVRGGTIRLTVHDLDRDLILAEGLETALSASEIFGSPAWSVVYAGGLKTAELPSAVRRIIIAVDHDESGCSQRNAIEAAQQWEAEGRTVRTVLPKTVGDFNDILVKRRG